MLGKETKNFWVLCSAIFLFMASFNLLMPELNHFITALGGAHHKGLIITLFSVSAAISRPFSGKLSDNIGRKKVLYIGIIICFFVALSYSFVTSLAFFLFLRFFHGFSAGFFPTGATALVTDILPSEWRAKGMGIWGVFISLGIGVGQSVGSFIYNLVGIDGLFLISAGIAALSGVLVGYVRESLPTPQAFRKEHLRVSLQDVFEPNVLPAAAVMFLTATCSGIIFVLTPDICDYLEIPNKGWFFGFYVISTISIRLVSSRLSDRIGRRKTLVIGISLLVLSMLLTGYASDKTSFTLAAIVFGVATGISSPTVFTWTADLSHVDRRGVGAGTMFIAMELGIMFGSISTVFTYHNTASSISNSFVFGAITALLAIAYLIWHIKKRVSLT
jgi:MFS family permease